MLERKNIKLYLNGQFFDTGFSFYTKPIIIVGSGFDRFRPCTNIGENISSALRAEKIDFVRSWSEWPKDEWVYHNGVYIPNQERYTSEGFPSYSIDQGGNYVFGNEFCFVSEGQVYDKNNRKLVDSFIAEIKLATGVNSVYIMPFMGHKHIDLTISFIPWKKLFVFDRTYFELHKSSIETILDDLNANFITTEEKLGANIFVYDYSTEFGEDRFVVTYAAPKTSKELEKKGIRVIQPLNADVNHLSYFGGASCAMNKIHCISLLPMILSDAQAELKRVYIINPHLK